MDAPDIEYQPDFLDDETQRALMARILATSPLAVAEVVVYGKRHETPRRVAWHADPGYAYRYSALTHEPTPWTEPLSWLRDRLEARLGVRFPGVLVNHYRSGQDAMGFHADDEPILGPEPTIASVSLGAARRFVFKPRRADSGAEPVSLELAPGSLLVMRGRTQLEWLHGVPRTKRPVGERINLTWRPWCRQG